MSDPVDTAASGVGIASFILQVFNQIVQGYQFWSKVSSVPQRHEHSLFRIELEENRFKTCNEKTGIADPNARFSHDELEIRKPLIEKLVTKVKELLLEAKQISEKYKPGTLGKVKWATGDQDDLERLGNQKVKQQQDLDMILRKQIQTEQNIPRLQGLSDALAPIHANWMNKAFPETHAHEILLRSLIRREVEQQTIQQTYLRQLIAVKEHLQLSLDQFEHGYPFNDVKELPPYESILTDQDTESKRFYDKDRQQWIEWRDREDVTQQTEIRIRLLVHLLQKRKPASFRSPRCIGYTKRSFPNETIQYGLVLAYQEQAFDPGLTTRLLTLRELLSQKDTEPSLSDKMVFCMVLARCIHEFHTIGWLHKGIRSTNIVFVVEEGKPAEFHKPYLTGFELARPNILKDLTTRPRVVALHEEIYRHPNAQSPGSSSNYRRSYDLHSLGIVFIEMVLWKPIEEVLRLTLGPAERGKIRHIKDILQKRQCDRSVAIAAGDGFAQVIKHCLYADVVEMQAHDESTAELDIQDLMSQKIVAPLEKLALALSAS